MFCVSRAEFSGTHYRKRQIYGIKSGGIFGKNDTITGKLELDNQH